MKARTKPKGFGIAAMIAVPHIAAVSAPASAATSVSIGDAETVASFYVHYIPTFIDNYSEWQKATAVQSTVYHELDGKKSAYAFDVIENGRYVDYILVSATKDDYPILEFSTSRTPNAITELTTRSETLAQERVETVGEAKTLYLGATFYYAEYPLIDAKGEVADSAVVDLTVPVIIELDASQVKIPIDAKDLLEQQQRRMQLWNALEENMKTTSPKVQRRHADWGGSAAYLYVYGDVDALQLRQGWFMYWDSHGYPDSLEHHNDAIDELGVAMYTRIPPRSPGETYNIDVAPGIEEVCDTPNYSGFDAQLEPIAWNMVKEGVDASRPFVLHMQQGGTGSGHSEPCGNHSVTGLGSCDYDKDYVVIRGMGQTYSRDSVRQPELKLNRDDPGDTAINHLFLFFYILGS